MPWSSSPSCDMMTFVNTDFMSCLNETYAEIPELRTHTSHTHAPGAGPKRQSGENIPVPRRREKDEKRAFPRPRVPRGAAGPRADGAPPAAPPPPGAHLDCSLAAAAPPQTTDD